MLRWQLHSWSQFIGYQLCLMKFVVCRLMQGQQGVFQRPGVGLVISRQQLRFAAGKIKQRRVYAIQAGAGHDADIKFCFAHAGRSAGDVIPVWQACHR